MPVVTELTREAPCAGCPGCATHPALLPGVHLSLLPKPLPEKAFGSRRRSKVKKAMFITGGITVALIGAVAAYMGISLYKIDHAVHHVAIPASLLADGKNDLLAVVKGPDHHEAIYAFNTKAGHTNVLLVPGTLGVKKGVNTVRLDSLDIHQPIAIISGLRTLGIPVARYVAVDLHAANPNSSLGRLALGKIDMASLVSHPAGTTSLLEAVASHVYLGPHTSVSSLLSLMNVPTGTPVSVPTTTANGQVVLAEPAVGVLRHFF
jgi:hypothetical protein